MSKISKDAVKVHLMLVKRTRKKGALASTTSEKQMVKKHASKHPPSIYRVNDEVLVQFDSNKKSNKVKAKGVSVPLSYSGKVIKCNIKSNRYKINVDVEARESTLLSGSV